MSRNWRKVLPWLALLMGVLGAVAGLWPFGRDARAAQAPAAARPVPVVPADVAAPPSAAARSPTGITSLQLAPGTGTLQPGDDDRVTLRFSTWKRDGTLLASTLGHEPRTNVVRSLMPGVAESVRTMRVGERRRCWIPAALTQQSSDDGDEDADEGPLRAPLDITVDLELVALAPAPRPPPLAAAPTARNTASGLAYEFERQNLGAASAQFAPSVVLHYSAWTKTGALVETTAFAGSPRKAAPAELVSWLAEGVRLMHVGDKARFWLPAEPTGIARTTQRRAKVPFVYEVELVAIE